MNLTLTYNEWFAIMNALDYTAANYRPDAHGVDMHELSETIRKNYMQKIQEEESR